MTRWTAVLLLALSLTLGLTACSSNKRRAARKAQGARRGSPTASAAGTRSQARTTDSGSRYIDTARPVGGIAVETSPIAGGALVLPYVTWRSPAGPESGSPAPAQGMNPDGLPAPALLPRGRIPPPPPPPDWP